MNTLSSKMSAGGLHQSVKSGFRMQSSLDLILMGYAKTCFIFAVSLAIIIGCIRCAQGQIPVIAIYDLGQIPQAKQVATYRKIQKKSPLVAILNPNSGPSTPEIRKPFLTWQPAESVINAGYVDLDDDSGKQRQSTAIRGEILVWKSAGVQMIFLDDCHAWDDPKKANNLADTVLSAIKDTGYTTDKIILNAGGVVGKASQWMRAKSYIVCDFEDPINYLKASTGQMWLGFVADGPAAKSLISKAPKTVKYIGFDLLANWHKAGKEWQTPLSPDIISVLSNL